MSEELRKNDEPVKIPERLPVLPLRDIVIFPFMIVPLYVSRERSIKAVDQALAENRMILLAAQKQQDDEDPGPDDIYPVGTVALIMRMLKLPDGRIRVLVQGIGRARITGFDETQQQHLQATIEAVSEAEVTEKGLEIEALMRNVKAALEKSANLGKPISPEVIVIATNMEEPGRLADLTASNLDLKVEGAQEILEALDPLDRLRRVHELMAKELEVLAMQQEISSQAKGEMDRSQREFFLRQQLKAIQTELGEGNELSEEIAGLKEKAAKARMPKPVMEEVERQLKKLERMHPDSAETATLRNWLDWMVTLPWGRSSRDNLDLADAQRILDEDHYGLEKVKERIIEYLAVRKLKDRMKGPLLCFVGPPGVGKTSLGRSIARALGRKFVRLSLGGVKDEAEIRGHRRTYVGSMPGRIIQGIHQAGTNNPVFMMDEVDKIGADYRGDPSSALLEVLDPEQNNSFRDHYLGVPFDLSNVMFICTANLTDTIQAAFLDRMEVLRLSGYTEDEKLEIAKRHLVPKQLEEHGITPEHLLVTDKSLRAMINGYTREAGLRNLEREIASITRKVARRVAEGKEGTVRITPAALPRFLGAPKILPEEMLKKDAVGIATGLAWTATGGDVLFVEATAMKGKGRLTLTGQLGEVMK
jgi:ATP-dependent Lon protease